MPDINIGSHLFDPASLAKAVADTVPAPKPGQRGALVTTVDSSGAKVALVLSTADGHWHVETAFAHDWTGDNKVGASASLTW